MQAQGLVELQSHHISFRWSICVSALLAAALCGTAWSQQPPRADSPVALVEQAARDWLAEQADTRGLADPVVEVQVLPAKQQALPACTQNPSVEALDTRSLLRLRFALICPGPEGWQRDWTVRAAVSAQVVVAVRNVPANQPLAADDLALERRRITDLAGAVTIPEDAVGQSSSRTLRSGDALHVRWLASPLLVKRGQAVTIIARNAGIEVRANGEALEPGRLRQVVRVRNSSTNRIIRARVLEDGVVEPEVIGGQSVR